MTLPVPKPFVLLILDGWGIDDDGPSNAIHMANAVNFKTLLKEYPATQLESAGEAVGLMPGQMGNSNVGHLNLGAGRIVYQDLTRIFRSIRDGSFGAIPVLKEVLAYARSRGRIHLMGLLSDGGVHSHIEHLFALIREASSAGVDRVFLHCFTDGRDVGPHTGITYIQQLQEFIRGYPGVSISTIMGRYYAMDRDKRWERTERAYRALTAAKGCKAEGATQAVEESYRQGVTDEFILPCILDAEGTIRPQDAVIFFNFRADRARQISRAFTDPGFCEFERNGYLDVRFVSMTRYDQEFKFPAMFEPIILKNTIGEVLSAQGLRQLRLAETEKYAHVTFFFNGGEENPFPGEERVLIPSPKVATYDLQPEMSAKPLTDEFRRRARSGLYDVIIMNFANPDMVGHTGSLPACIKAIKTVDQCIGEVVKTTLEIGGGVIVVADHGNAETMVDEDGGPHTAHTANRVPFILVYPALKNARLRPGKLADVAPTILEILGIEKPPQMEGESLLETEVQR
ncbi:MAG: 2,3-bisphosphoglycerate-independent phosphoglycerate mutase [Bacillota bacterium]